jgi:hypothetical protein
MWLQEAPLSEPLFLHALLRNTSGLAVSTHIDASKVYEPGAEKKTPLRRTHIPSLEVDTTDVYAHGIVDAPCIAGRYRTRT